MVLTHEPSLALISVTEFPSVFAIQRWVPSEAIPAGNAKPYEPPEIVPNR